jgi:hypothetical protein
LFPFTVVSTPVVTPVVTTTTPVVTATPIFTAAATLYPIPTTTTTTLYPVATASATLYPVIVGCAPKACPLVLSCLLPSLLKTDLMADGCPGCPHCVNPDLPCCAPIVLPGQVCRDCSVVYL